MGAREGSGWNGSPDGIFRRFVLGLEMGDGFFTWLIGAQSKVEQLRRV